MTQVLQGDNLHSADKFDVVAGEYVIGRPDTPREWYNYLWNADFVACFSQTGQGESLMQDRMGRRIAAVSSRMLYLRDTDSGEFTILNGLPVDAPHGRYRCRHGMGYSVIEQTALGVASSWRCFVPVSEPCEFWTCTLRNTGATTRHFTLFGYCGTTYDGTFRPQIYYQPFGGFDARRQAVILTNPRHRFGQSESTLLFMTVDAKPAGYGTTLRGFVGYGTEQRPDAVLRGRCRNDEAVMEKCCLALVVPLRLSPGAERTVHFAVGAGTDRRQIDRVRRLFRTDSAEREIVKVRAGVLAQVGRLRIQTPDARLNAFFDPWLKRQVSLGIQWARVRHNGFRDQIQDIWGMTVINPVEARRQLARVLSYQYSSGYAPRTWVDGKIMDRNFSDNHVWIAFAAHQLVMESGDPALLDESIPFNDGSTATLYDHVKRAVGYYWKDRGLHGLLRIRSGDWNDCLDAVGPQGRGVSVWLSMAWVLASEQFAQLAELAGKPRDAAIARQRAKTMKRLINRVAWDGAWYVRAFDDQGQVLGSRKNKRGSLYLLTQAWAVIAGVGERGRGLAAMKAVDRLLESKLGTLKLLRPYDRWDPAIGYSTIKRPFVHENGGVYLHASCFKLMADCMMGRSDKVSQALGTMLPFDQSVWPKNGEPYVFSNSYFADRDSYRYGMSGQSWGTGTAAWFVVVMVQHIFGLHPTVDGLQVRPCLPPEWRRCSIRRPFRSAAYDVAFRQTGKGGCVKSILVDGLPIQGHVLPWRKGAHYCVEVELG
jgi:cellobiose phosphorylase